MKESKTEFEEGLNTGNPFELMALKFGKVIKDDGFLKSLQPSSYPPSEKTHDVWLRSGLNHYSKMINASYFHHDFYHSAYHSFRSFSRSILLEEKGVLLESDISIKESLSDFDNKASDYFWSLRKDRLEEPCTVIKNSKDRIEIDHRETFKKVDYIGEKAMSGRGKIFPSYNRLIELVEEQDFSGYRMFQRDNKTIDFSFRSDDGFEIFEFNMKTGTVENVG